MSHSRKRQIRERTKRRIRSRIQGSRIIVYRSNRHMYAQLVNEEGRVIAGVSTLTKVIREKVKTTSNKDAALAVGKAIGELVKKNKIAKVSFDRSGYLYHGRVQMVAEGIRSSKVNI